ncbi:IclR family transcriptional regulator [Ammoniphilus sp. YIM 78166]|uniref:IclR family transcriptional regulator n=1 Tax=Ammoniphilus sp. YIM 78166 TaxID=1644106 RepID=UPI0010704F81|nr:IclR family transcriptional regulator [Ammoniphilus sp. YIM 78166]
MEARKSNEEYLLWSVKNALRILRSFSQEEPEKKVTDLSLSLGLSKSTISRLLLTLASEEFVTQNPKTRRYRLGQSILTLSSIASSEQNALTESLPIIHKLVASINESVQFMILEDLEVSYIFSIEKSHAVKYYGHIGKKAPAYCTSSGKVIIAYQEAELIDKIIHHGLRPFTRKTITTERRFRETLEQIRSQGYAVSEEEFQEGIVDIAAPIRDAEGCVFAAISIPVPIQAVNRKKLAHLIKEAQAAGREISERLSMED